MKKGLRAALAVWLACLAAGVGAQSGEERVLAAREALRTGDRNTLERLARAPDRHVLDPYVRYWLLFNKLARKEPAPAAELNDFLLRESGSFLAERLRGDWLRRMVVDGDWAGFLRLYPDLQLPDAELRCHSWHARLQSGDASLAAEVGAQWSELSGNHAACEPALRGLAMSGQVSRDDIWWRFRRQIDSRTPAAARATLAWLPAGEAPAAAELERALKSPGPYLDRLPANFAATRAGREVALAALARLARETDATAAHQRFSRISDRLGHEERAYVHALLGHHGALSRLPQAAAWYRAAGEVPMTEVQRAWRVRAALRNEDWRMVQSSIEALRESERDRPEWIYWLARAHVAQGRLAEGQALYRRISGEPHFYGLLAGEELGVLFAPPPRNDPEAAEDMARAESDPGLRRSLALYRLDMRTDATREWNWAVRGRDEGFLVAAARLALRHEIFDRAISTADRTNPQANFELRFISPFRELVEPEVLRQGLDMGWVYGVMRQESRFTVPARSSAGAQGLMQVMPATGKWVAGKIGMSNYTPGMLMDPTTNVQLGTSYMRLIMEGLDNHPVLAAAGYNAGPSRARRWRDARALEGALYAETIPFDETRDYVKKVMANAVVYAAMFEGRPQSLKKRLGTIAPRLPADG